MSEKDFLANLQQHQRIIYKLVNIYARNPDDKKDLQQEIILQAWKSYAKFRGESKFSTWLYRLSLNTIFTMRGRPAAIEYRDDLEALPVAASPHEANEDAERLYQAIRQLNDVEKAVISLHLDGYDNNEIAEHMGISNNLVAVKVHRARQKLAEILKRI